MQTNCPSTTLLTALMTREPFCATLNTPPAVTSSPSLSQRYEGAGLPVTWHGSAAVSPVTLVTVTLSTPTSGASGVTWGRGAYGTVCQWSAMLQ